MNNYTEKMERLFAEEIRNEMSSFGLPYHHEFEDDDKEVFLKVRNVSFLISELLNNEQTKEKLRLLSKRSSVNGDDIEIKLKFFAILRNIITHFPIFHSWDEINLSKGMLEWNNVKNGTILKFFTDFADKELSYFIYEYDYFERRWVVSRSIKIKIPQLSDNDIIYLKDIISLNDVIWTFCIIDYYLDYLGYGLGEVCHLSV